MSFDASELDALGDELARAAARIAPKVKQVVSKGSLNIKNQIKKDFLASRHFGSTKAGAVVPNISYNLNVEDGAIEGEIAPFVDQEGFGSFVGIAIFGGSRGGGGTVADPLIALQAEEPKFITALTDLAGVILDD